MRLKNKDSSLNDDVNLLKILEVFSDELSKKKIENTLQILYSIELMIQDMDFINVSNHYLSYLYVRNYKAMKSENCVPVKSPFFDEILDTFI